MTHESADTCADRADEDAADEPEEEVGSEASSGGAANRGVEQSADWEEHSHRQDRRSSPGESAGDGSDPAR